MNSQRYFKNTYKIKDPSDKLSEKDEKMILENMNKFEEMIEAEKEKFECYNMYIGDAGILYYYLNCYFNKKEKGFYLSKCSKYVTNLTRLIDNIKYYNESEIQADTTFICGVVGPMSLLAVYYDIKNNQTEVENYIADIKSFIEYSSQSRSCELLYGKSGYLYTMNFLNSYFNKEIFSIEIQKPICESILSLGENTATKFNKKNMYIWSEMNNVFIGAAHGLSGIIYQLLNIQYILDDKKIMKKIENTINLILEYQDEEGNFGEANEKLDLLCHFCYGAPGIIPTLLKLYKINKDEKLLISCQKAANSIWKYGLLKKGFGLCHGISGNAYSFLKMYEVTKDVKYYQMALEFSKFICNEENQKKLITKPDHRISLFEGISGTILFLEDLINKKSNFPAYDFPEWKNI
eukprot:gene7572-11896_t